MNDMLTISQLGKHAGVSAKAIRFYESIGLIAPAKRAANGYRTYSPRAMSELKVIKYARDLGLPIAEIKRLMQGCSAQGCAHSKEYLENEITGYTKQLDEKIIELTVLKNKLESLKQSLGKKGECTDTNAYCCNILGQLAGSLKGGEEQCTKTDVAAAAIAAAK